MKDLGCAKKILGMEIIRNKRKGTIFLTQKKYLEKILEAFRMTSCKPVKTPLALYFKFLSLQCPN